MILYQCFPLLQSFPLFLRSFNLILCSTEMKVNLVRNWFSLLGPQFHYMGNISPLFFTSSRNTPNFVKFYEKLKSGRKDLGQVIFLIEVLHECMGMNCICRMKYTLNIIKFYKLVELTLLQEITKHHDATAPN